MPKPTPNQAQAALAERLTRRWIDFGRLLRRNGVAVTAGQVRDLLRTMPLLDLHDRDAVYHASRALLCSRKEDLPRFDLAFRQFWGRTRQIIIPSDTGSLTEQQSAPKVRQSKLEQRNQDNPAAPPIVPLIERTSLSEAENEQEQSGGSNDEQVTQALLYSAQERLNSLDFARFTDEEIAAAKALLATWKWEPGMRRTRRLAPLKRGRRLDAARTMRRAMRTEGIPYTLSMRGPRTKPRPLVLLCDISGSMAPYTRMMLHFLHTLRREVGHAEVFVFGTRLTRITRQLRVRDIDSALADVTKQVSDWSGGTRTGEALRTFNTQWARRVLGQGAVVCIISDGWDRGDPALLVNELAHLQRTAFRLVWLNPLLGIAGYRPLTRGMAAALPYIDDFLPANNLNSLHELADLLTSLNLNTRPSRRQSLLPPPTASVSTSHSGPAFTVAPSTS
ncbi:MAG: VWA domain-containing protein [Chloroflexota bacterium]